jgi:hypothetical protein
MLRNLQGNRSNDQVARPGMSFTTRFPVLEGRGRSRYRSNCLAYNRSGGYGLAPKTQGYTINKQWTGKQSRTVDEEDIALEECPSLYLHFL